MCPKCNVHGDWSILERLVKKSKVESTVKDLIDKSQKSAKQFDMDWQKIIHETTSITELNETEQLDLFRLFEFPVSIMYYILVALMLYLLKVEQVGMLVSFKHTNSSKNL